MVMIESTVPGTTQGICINLEEIASFYGDGGRTYVNMKSGETHIVANSFEKFKDMYARAVRML